MALILTLSNLADEVMGCTPQRVKEHDLESLQKRTIQRVSQSRVGMVVGCCWPKPCRSIPTHGYSFHSAGGSLGVKLDNGRIGKNSLGADDRTQPTSRGSSL